MSVILEKIADVRGKSTTAITQLESLQSSLEDLESSLRTDKAKWANLEIAIDDFDMRETYTSARRVIEAARRLLDG